MRIALVLLLSAVTLGAGCLGADVVPAELSAESPPADPVAAVIAHQSFGPVEIPPSWASYRTRVLESGIPGIEPSIGITSDGTLFVTANDARHHVARSRDRGVTWEIVGDIAKDSPVSLDPWLHVDPVTDRIWNAPLYVGCSWATWSDDGGETWVANPITGCGLPAHDHQKLTTGPPAAGVTTAGYPNVVYYAYNSFIGVETDHRLGTIVTTSLDGGLTWAPGVMAHKSDPCHRGVNGPVAVAPDGTAYVAHATCTGLDVAVSRDSGATWSITGHLDSVGSLAPIGLPVDVAVDAAGNAFVTWPGADGIPYLSRSTDAGASWSDPVAVAPPGITATTFVNNAAGAPGRLAISYLATRSDTSQWASLDPSDAPADTVWHFMMAVVPDALAEDPVILTMQVTPDDDPVQIGCIWMRGGSNPCRNLYDFNDLVIHEGRAVAVFTDGCPACSSAAASRSSDLSLAVMDGGPRLDDLGSLDAWLVDRS